MKSKHIESADVAGFVRADSIWQLLLQAVPASRSSSAPSAHLAHDVHRTAAAASAVKGAAGKTAGTASPLFASAAAASKAGAVAKAPARPTSKFLRHEVQAAGKAAIKVAALAKSVKSAIKTSLAKQNDINRERVKKIPLHTAMRIVETGAANSLAQADKNAVEAALLRAALSMPGQRKAEKAAAAAAARAAANKPSAAWLAGEKALADRNPYAAMNIPGPHQQALAQQRANIPRGRPALSKSGISPVEELLHKGYSPEEQQAYKDQAGRKTFSENSIDMTGNARAFAQFPVSADPDIRDGVKKAPDYNHPYVKATEDIGRHVKPEDIQTHWAHGYYHPYQIVKRDDRYVPVGRLLTHRDGVTRRESKQPLAANGQEQEDEDGDEAHEEPEDAAPADCRWGKDVYGRCYTECTPSHTNYTLCHDGSPIWKDPMPLKSLCKEHACASWCINEYPPEDPSVCDPPKSEEEEEAGTKARTVQLASVDGCV